MKSFYSLRKFKLKSLRTISLSDFWVFMKPSDSCSQNWIDSQLSSVFFFLTSFTSFWVISRQILSNTQKGVTELVSLTTTWGIYLSQTTNKTMEHLENPCMHLYIQESGHMTYDDISSIRLLTFKEHYSLIICIYWLRHLL